MQVIANKSTITVTSALSLELVKQAQTYVPSALTVRDESGSVLYRVNTDDKQGILKPYGVSFNTQKNDNLGVLVNITLSASANVEKVVEEFLSDHALSLAALAKYESIVELQINEALAPILASISQPVVYE